MPALDFIELKSSQAATHTIIWLHGLGADGQDFVPVAEELNSPNLLPVKFIFPHAPVRPVSLNAGMAMRAWYDIFALDENAPEDAIGIKESLASIDELIQLENEMGIANDRIFLAGFSQGCALALSYACQSLQQLAGIIALSGYLPLASSYTNIAKEAIKTPIFMAHGQTDSILPLHFGQASRDKLGQLGFNIDWHEYAIPHSVCAQEIADIKIWLQQIINDSIQTQTF